LPSGQVLIFAKKSGALTKEKATELLKGSDYKLKAFKKS